MDQKVAEEERVYCHGSNHMKEKRTLQYGLYNTHDVTNVPTCCIVVLWSMWLRHMFLQWVGLEGVWHLGRVGWVVDPCLQNAPSEDNQEKNNMNTYQTD